MGYLHHSTIGEADFHNAQKKVGLEQTKIDQDVATRARLKLKVRASKFAECQEA